MYAAGPNSFQTPKTKCSGLNPSVSSIVLIFWFHSEQVLYRSSCKIASFCTIKIPWCTVKGIETDAADNLNLSPTNRKLCTILLWTGSPPTSWYCSMTDAASSSLFFFSPSLNWQPCSRSMHLCFVCFAGAHLFDVDTPFSGIVLSALYHSE